jgi:nucleotidyltransferase/DNA polymerase involved in DNA repair
MTEKATEVHFLNKEEIFEFLDCHYWLSDFYEDTIKKLIDLYPHNIFLIVSIKNYINHINGYREKTPVLSIRIKTKDMDSFSSNVIKLFHKFQKDWLSEASSRYRNYIEVEIG